MLLISHPEKHIRPDHCFKSVLAANPGHHIQMPLHYIRFFLRSEQGLMPPPPQAECFIHTDMDAAAAQRRFPERDYFADQRLGPGVINHHDSF